MHYPLMLDPSGGSQTERSGVSQANKALAERWVEEVWNQQRLDVIDELHAEDYVRHHDSDGGAGREHYKAHAGNVMTLLPDIHCRIEQLIAEGDLVMLRLVVTGSHQGAYGDVAPTGRPIEFETVEILRFVDGQLKESWHSYDRLSLLEQMGAAKGVEFADAARSG
jgi:predicted ester cyclase